MHTGNERDSKVVSLSERSDAKKAADKVEAAHDVAAPSQDWSDIMKRNAENASRMKKEREKANKGVIRSYRLKH